MHQAEDSSPSKETDGDDASFLRTEDVICLVCTSSGDAMTRGYLAAEGFGSQVCHLQLDPRSKEPYELWKCTFQLEDALSVHAMYTQGLKSRDKKQGSRKILIYGHAVLLRHISTKKLLRCLPTSPSTDKLAYNIGFTDQPDKSSVDESCWFQVHPASKQRSEGEKVRAGDDVFLVNIANERFLSSSFPSAEYDPSSAAKNTVLASFVQCVWALHIVCSGSAKEEAIGYVNGGDTVRLLHRHKGEDCLAVTARSCDRSIKADRTTPDVCYEPVDHASGALLRSLWRVELLKMRFGWGFTSWGQWFRLRHVATGKFLGMIVNSTHRGSVAFSSLASLETSHVTEGRSHRERHTVALLDPSEASLDASAFCFSNSNSVNGNLGSYEVKEDSMGTPQVKFGDSEVYLVHCLSRRFVGSVVSERGRHRNLQGLKKVLMQEEPHQSFIFTVTRASEEPAKAAATIQLTEDVMRNYVHKMVLSSSEGSSHYLQDKLLCVLSDLIHYFRMPQPQFLSHDEYQQQLCVLTERQNLFQKQGMLLLTLAVIEETGKICRHCSETTQNIHHKLYALLAAMIRGNHNNCREFATCEWLTVFIQQLSMPPFTHDVLEVIQCLLTDSPEVLNIVTEDHIKAIVRLLITNGRDAKVMKLLSSLCVCQGVAMRDKQRLIYHHLLTCRDLLVQTSLHDFVHCLHPNVYISICDGSAMYHRWYFEVEIIQLSVQPKKSPHFRVGWAHASLFHPRPSSNGIITTCGGIGDDMFSLGFDGELMWAGGHSHEPGQRRKLHRQGTIGVRPVSPSCGKGSVSVGDVIGCCLDLQQGHVWFTRNGEKLSGHLQFGPWRDMITPAISFSAGVSAVISLGGRLGKFRYAPPMGFASLHEAVNKDVEVQLRPFLCQGMSSELLVTGPALLADHQGFVPAPINTSKVALPDPVMRVRESLARNIHEVWAKNKIEAGYSFAEVRDDSLKQTPLLKPFEDLTEGEQRYDYSMALETLRTLVTLDYHISFREEDHTPLHFLQLSPEQYQQPNGYLPRLLDLAGVVLEEGLTDLVEKLAENAHNVWAASRIKDGWTYGIASDNEAKRNSLLVPYSKLDDTVKKSNWDTAYESVRTICALGCCIQPPSTRLAPSIQQLAREFSNSHARTCTFRGQTCYALKQGKWYYEVKLLSEGMMRVGWATPTFPAGQLLGSDDRSYAFDGYLACKWHNGSESFGQRWKKGDIVGCLLDNNEKTISFTLNGELLQDSFDSTIAFEQISAPEGLMPSITLAAGQRAQLNFGRSKEALHYDYSDTGYEAVCSPVSLHYNIPLWYSSLQGAYHVIDSTHPRLAVKRRRSKRQLQAGPLAMTSVSCVDWDYSHHSYQECLRLNLGVTLAMQAASPTLPTIHPRPGPLSPSPTADMDLNQVFSHYLAAGPQKLKASYSVAIPAGQDPGAVFIGWTTAGFRYIESQFQSRSHSRSPSAVPSCQQYGQCVEVFASHRPSRGSLGGQGKPSSMATHRTAFLVCLASLMEDPSSHLAVPARVSCIIDLTSGRMTFSCTTSVDLPDSPPRQVVLTARDTCKLFPTAIITPSSEKVIDFDFFPEAGCQSLISLLFSEQFDKKLPCCLPRMKLMALSPSRWVRQPTHMAKFSTHLATGGSLHLVANREPNYSIYATLPEEETVMDILEVSEDHKLLEFYTQTLEAYRAVCSHGNLQLSASIGLILDPEQLVESLRMAGMRYSLRGAYFNLLSMLHLDPEVRTRLMMRGEFILLRSECTRSVSLFRMASRLEGQRAQPQVCRLAMAPLPGLDYSRNNQASISHNITSTFSRTPCSDSKSGFALEELKEIVFADLEELLKTGYYKGQILPCHGSHEIFVPLLHTLDRLLVMGAIQEDSDLQRLLRLLDPQEFATGKNRLPYGLLSAEVATEEPIKLVLCDLLQHLCDCQVQHRVEAIATFAHGFVESLQEEQRERYKKDFKNKPKEFRTSPEKQVEAMLSFLGGSSPDCYLGPQLQSNLRAFHKELRKHCGCTSDPSLSRARLEELGVRGKLARLLQLLIAMKEEQQEKEGGDHVATLQQLITHTMLEWARQEVQSPQLIEEIFTLLFRQYDEVHEVMQALKKTYIVEVTNNSRGQPKYDITSFRHCLGTLRLLLTVGMGRAEEDLLKRALQSICCSDLFYCHPHLMRSLGVHLTALELMRSYLGISSWGDNKVLSSRRKQKLAMSKEELPAPVEACCQFLCKFARISPENQRALFGHIGYLLEHSEKHPGLMTYRGFTPLDVVTATIKDHQELALALEEAHLEHVVSLLVATTTSMTEADFYDPLGRVNVQSLSCDWAPNGGEKCLEFLQSAVWVDNEQILENAYLVVRLLIRNSECLGPALAGEALGLRRVYEEAVEQLDEAAFSRSLSKQESVAQDIPESIEHTINRSTSFLGLSLLNMRLVLSFYTSLVRLLACCAPNPTHSPAQPGPASSQLGAGKQLNSNAERTLNILQNMVKVEEIAGILSIPFSADNHKGLFPPHKEAALLFLDRVYHVMSPELLLQLLTDAFLPDIKMALRLTEMSSQPELYASLCRYLCCSVLPLLTRHAAVFRQLLSHLHVVDSLLACCLRFASTTQLSSNQLEALATFLITITRELHPRAVLKYMPKLIASIDNLQPSSIVALKLLSSHYKHFMRYYESGMLVLGRSRMGLAGEEEKTCSAIIIYRLLDALAKKLPSDSQQLQLALSCLRAVSCAMGPDSLIPSRPRLATMYSSSSSGYEPRPVDIGRVLLPPELQVFLKDFASYLHDLWLYEKQSTGWVYGPELSEDHCQHPSIKPFGSLPEQERAGLLGPAEAALRYLLARGWTLSKIRHVELDSLPIKPQMTCIRPKKHRAQSQGGEEERPYQPSVADLSKVEVPMELLAMAEQMAENAHDKWARELKNTDPDYLSHAHFRPYELLDEAVTEERRCYALDLLRYLRVSGFELSYTRVSLSSHDKGTHTTACHEKFSLQLFQKFLDLLTQGLDLVFYLKVLFPTMTSYLSQHAGYFMPSSGQRSHSFASNEEKLIILKLFCRVMEFTRRHLSHLFPTKTPSGQFLTSPAKAQPSSSNGSNFSTARGIVGFLESCIRALDASGVVKSSCGSAQDCSELVDFFRQATSGIHLTAKNIAKPDKVDASFHFYCLHVLIPSLAGLFRHLGFHGTGKFIIEGPVMNHCKHIFRDLVEMAMGSGPVFVGSSPLIAIGKCMGAFASAYPEPFLEKNTFDVVNMESLISQLVRATSEGVTCGNVLFVVDVIIPVLVSYIIRWWKSSRGSSLSQLQVDQVLTHILSLMAAHFGQSSVKWLYRVIESTLLLSTKCSLPVLSSHFMPLMNDLRERAIALWQDEQYLSTSWSPALEDDSASDHQQSLVEDYHIFVRDLTCILPYLAIFLVSNTESLREDVPCCSFDSKGCESPVRRLFVSVADIFHCWFSSQYFRREFQASIQGLMQSTRTLLFHPLLIAMRRPGETGRAGQLKKNPNLILHCLELLLPLNSQFLSPEDRDLVEQYRIKFRRKGATSEDLKVELVRDLERKSMLAPAPLAHKLVRHISRQFSSTLLTKSEKTVEERAHHILSLATVRHRIYQLENPSMVHRRWKQVFSQRKKNAVIKCFLAVPFFQLPMPRAINIFLQAYCSTWLMSAEHANHELLTEELLDHQDFLQCRVSTPDPLTQLFTMFKRMASVSGHINRTLYTAYANVISKTVIGFSEEDGKTDDDTVTKAYELYYQQMAQFMVRQGQLAKRGAPTMLLQVITACDGSICQVVHSTLRLGIALLKEGNEKIQHEMLMELKGMDVGFLSSISKLISSCSVLNWNAYERYNKSEPLHTSSTSMCCKVLPESAFTVSLFRFLQLLCEGHNQAFQDYLRTQAGNTTTVNIIIYTVDYLLRLQESISDFYWHYSDHDTIDLPGRENFLKAFKVAKQIFRTLTEYIQGPCVQNQEALARSRLWDAVFGFLHIFAELERKLYRDTSQVELLRELLGLQEEMFILLLSMLEGSAMSSNIGKLMVDMLVESAQWIKDIMSFFGIFVKLKDVTTSKAFKEYDQNKDGLISYREFEMAMEAQQSYSKEEIAYLMECADTNKDGLLDYMEFTERFHQPAESIGFHLCVLIVHLSDHLPNDHRLKRFRESPQGKGLMEHFQSSMGCIEILGKSGRIERVYFELKESCCKQWEETQIQESKRAFLRSVETGSQKNKLQGFINFCEDTIFEMDYADKISGTEQEERESRAEQHRRKHNRALQLPSQPFFSDIRARVQAFRQESSLLQKVVTWLTVLWTFILTRALPACKTAFNSLRSRASSAYSSLRQWQQASSGPTPQMIKHQKRTSLKINIPPPSSVAAPKSAVGETGEMFTRDRSHSHDAATGHRKTSLSLSPDVQSRARSGSHILTPLTSQRRQLNLAYDRHRMKPPSGYLDSASPSLSSALPLGPDITDSYMPKIRIAARGWQAFLARHYYRLDYGKLILTFFINLLLLTFRVPGYLETGELQDGNETVLELGGSFWNPILLNSFSILHFLLSAVLIASYWHLKVPLIIFKREKQVARQLEDKLLWVKQSPSRAMEYWDSLVISSTSFPKKYWDKQVKQRVCDQFTGDKRSAVVRRLGMEVASKYEERTTLDIFEEILTSLVDLRYRLWMLGVVLSNKLVLYHILYCSLSFMGLRWNYFYFSIHLLDLVMSFKVLQTVLRSVLHNGKQLMMTVLMTCVVIYIYTVIAFNFFRKFYRQQTSVGEKVYQCESMARCFIYHIDQGLRSGGGIADVLESATGDPNEFLRLFFDITFFFFVIVILLAIIQGLIIDAFGELRDKEEAVTLEMQTKCFICGLPKTDFDHIPHGFDNHISREHNMAHYMFFLLYLIKKQESEFSGQESYVWELYLKRKWDFFPVGDCFRSQEGRKPSSTAQLKGKKSPGMPRKAHTIR